MAQAYFVPRSLLELPRPMSWYCEKLLPRLPEWRAQAAEQGVGDKSTLCRKFLNEILPYFVEVLVQDGVYFILEFPLHPLSQLLKVRLGSVLKYYDFNYVLAN